MERMTPTSVTQYYALSAIVLSIMIGTSLLSVHRHQTERLPRKYVLKFIDMLRSAARSSISSAQNNHPVQMFLDATEAQIKTDIAYAFLTDSQCRCMLGIDIAEMKMFVDGQHEKALEGMLIA
ncbi:unnamed protein product, partial [Phaeothamnion confervicola]